MRRKLFAGNWKLHKTIPEGLVLVRELQDKLAAVRDCDLVVAPPYTAIYPVAQALRGSGIAVGAQDLFYEEKGAFTGAVSAAMLADAGATYVIVAHSERRQLFGETTESSHRRLQAALRAALVPIFCVGETLPERETGRTSSVVSDQLEAGLGALTPAELATVVIAYEPVWAIGTGKVATPMQAQEVHALIRERLTRRSPELGQRTRILYGGSVKPDNARELMAQPDIDGALVGGASLDAASFVGIVVARA